MELAQDCNYSSSHASGWIYSLLGDDAVHTDLGHDHYATGA